MNGAKLLRVAVPVPLADACDYRWAGDGPRPAPGTRVEVPFGRGRRIGIVLEWPAASSLPPEKLKAVPAALDDEPPLDGELLEILRWAADYYHHPIGEVLAHALPGLLRKGRPVASRDERRVALTEIGRAQDPRALGAKAARQADALARLASGPATIGELREAGIGSAILRRLEEKGWIAAEPARVDGGRGGDPRRPHCAGPQLAKRFEPPPLTPDPRGALETIRGGGARAFLLYGVTGSGKTEIFLRLVAEQLEAGRQSLLLVPEIGLTPQLVKRLRERFGEALAVLHSGLAEGERLAAWRRARSGEA